MQKPNRDLELRRHLSYHKFKTKHLAYIITLANQQSTISKMLFSFP